MRFFFPDNSRRLHKLLLCLMPDVSCWCVFSFITVTFCVITQEKVLKALVIGLVEEATIWSLNYTPSPEKFLFAIYIKDSQQVGVLAQTYCTNCTKCYWITNYRNLTSLGKNIRTRTAKSTVVNGSLKLVYFKLLFMAKVFREPVYYSLIGRVKRRCLFHKEH